jgi:hypothetical protein
MKIFFHEGVVHLQIIVEEEGGEVVKTVDLPALAKGKPVSFSVRVETLDRATREEDETPEIVPLLCLRCSKGIKKCRCPRE